MKLKLKSIKKALNRLITGMKSPFIKKQSEIPELDLSQTNKKLLKWGSRSNEMHPNQIINIDNYFMNIDDKLRVIFKNPLLKLYYLYWLKQEGYDTNIAHAKNLHYLFLAELALYNEKDTQIFIKLSTTFYPDLNEIPDLDKSMEILSCLLQDQKSYIYSNMDNYIDRGSNEETKIFDLTSENYYKHVDIRIRPFFKSKDCLRLFKIWLETEELTVEQCFNEQQHNIFIEELMYYYNKGPQMFKSIIALVYRRFAEDPEFPRAIENISLLFGTFDKLVEETLKDLEVQFGPKVDKNRLANYGMDFGMILFYILKRDPANAIQHAKNIIGNIGKNSDGSEKEPIDDKKKIGS